MKCVLALIFAVAVCSAQENGTDEFFSGNDFNGTEFDNGQIEPVNLNYFVFGVLHEFFVGNNTAAEACEDQVNVTAPSVDDYVHCVAQANPEAVHFVATVLNSTDDKIVSGVASFINDVVNNNCSLNKLVLKFVDHLYAQANHSGIPEEVYEAIQQTLGADARQNEPPFPERDALCFMGEQAIQGLHLAQQSNDPDICFSPESLGALEGGLKFAGKVVLHCGAPPPPPQQ